MDNGDSTPEIREPAVWVLMRLGVNMPRSLSTHRPSAHSNYWLGMGARVRGLLFIPRPSQEECDKGPHEGLTEMKCGKVAAWTVLLIRSLSLRAVIENDLSKNTNFLLEP